MSYTATMNRQEFYWVAGFLEGEGSFTCSRTNKIYNGNSYRARITVGQKDKEPLERLQRAIGGKIYYSPAPSRTNPIYYWQTGGKEAIGLMMTFWTLLSKRRQKQIENSIMLWLNACNIPGKKKAAI